MPVAPTDENDEAERRAQPAEARFIRQRGTDDAQQSDPTAIRLPRTVLQPEAQPAELTNTLAREDQRVRR